MSGDVSALLLTLLVALGLTLLVEVPVGAAFGMRSRSAIASVVLVNLVTNPVANYLTFVAPRGFTLSWLVLLEVAIFLVEWRLLAWALGWSPQRAFLPVLVMNVASAALGFVLLALA